MRLFKHLFVFFASWFISLLLLILFLTSSVLAESNSASWTKIGLNSLSIRSLVSHPVNPDIIYAGTDDGIYKSIDKGNTWQATSNQGTPAFYIVISPSEPNILYATRGNTGVQKSVDGGNTWFDITNNLGTPISIHDIDIDPNDSNIVYLAMYGNCLGVWKTTDGGSTWRGTGGACDVYRIVVNPENPEVLYIGRNVGIFKSVNRAESWFNPGNQGLNSIGAVRGIALSPGNPDTIYIGTETNGIYKSINAAASWSFLPNSPPIIVASSITVDPFNHNLIYSKASPGVSQSIDGGSTWTLINSGETPTGIHRLMIFNNNPDSLYATTDSGVYVYGSPQSTQLPVPLLKQTNPFWGGYTYDSANLWAPPEPTDIARWGCALTSAAMVFQYYGITKLPDGAIDLDPGTLNVWLKNYTPLDPEADGYIRNGLVNWLAISRLSKLAKDQNPTFEYDALDYVRFDEDHDQLKTDLENNIPGILEVNNKKHFVVAKGTNSEDIFTINDPFYDREDLSSYSNTFSSLGRFLPSNTDLSYLMLVVDEGVNISVSSPSGELVGESFVQQPLENEETPGDLSGDPLRIFYLPDPGSGNYELALSSSNNNNYDLDVYYYDIDGNVRINYFSGIVGQGDEDNYSLLFDKNNVDDSNSTKVVTFDSLIDDLLSLRASGDINNFGVYSSVLTKANVAQGRGENIGTKTASGNLLKSFQKEITKQKGKGVSETAFNILNNDIQVLIENLN